MKLKNKYVIGCLVQFYEIEMLQEYVNSCVQMMEEVENPENVIFQFCLGLQEFLEECEQPLNGEDNGQRVFNPIYLRLKFIIIRSLFEKGFRVSWYEKWNKDEFYNVALYRRELCDKWCDEVDYICWGETDSLWPKQTLELMESLHQMVSHGTPKFVASFGGRKNWDSSWEVVTHPMFRKVQYEDTEDWILGNEASEKAYMTIERMNEINNIPLSHVDIIEMDTPKADGSCLIISSELVRSGVNIPRSLIHCGEDESFLQMAKIVMGSQFKQYNFNNILRVHNRRHPKKRMYIKDENNPQGFCDDRKGAWWKVLEDSSKFNLGTLRLQKKSIQMKDVLGEVKLIRYKELEKTELNND